MKNKMILSALLVAAMAAFSLTGCGERADHTPETQVETEAPTEAPTEKPTEKPTEAPTEKPTEAPTEKPTEVPVETEAPVPENLTADEEAARYTAYSSSVIFYAKDDMNIRETPTTENSDNIVSSYDQGEEVVVIGETPNWYKVQVDDWTGYIFKAVVSETIVEPKSESERAQILEEAGFAEAASAQPADVSAYQDSFTIQLADDANLRRSPSEQADVIGTVQKGSIIVTTGEAGNWYEVDVDGTIGYINKDLVG